MLVSGPTAAIVTGSAAASRIDRINSIAPSGRTRKAGLGQVRAFESAGAVDIRGDVQRSQQRAGGSGGHRDVRPAHQRQHAKRVASGGIEARVAGHRRDREQIQLGASQRDDDRQGIVVAWVAIEDQRDPGRHLASMREPRAMLYDALSVLARRGGPARFPCRHRAVSRATRLGGGSMHKRYGLTLFAGLAIIVAACSGGGASTAPSRRGVGRPTVRRGVGRPVGRGVGRARRHHLRRAAHASASSQTSAAINDKGFNQSAYEGMEAAKAEAPTCFETEYIETTSQSDYAANIAQFTDSGSDVVIGVGFLLGDALGDAAKANTDIKFISVDGVPNPGHDESWMTNGESLFFAEDEAGYLAGVLAASMSTSATSASSAASSSSRRWSASSRATSTARSRSTRTSRSTSCTRPRSSIRPRAATPPSR